MPWSMDLLQVESFLEASVPDLHQQWPIQIQELMLLVIGIQIGITGEVRDGRHAGRGMCLRHRLFRQLPGRV